MSTDTEAPEGEEDTGRGEGGRFAPGNKIGPGRPKGARNRLSESFLTDLEDVWKEKGKNALESLAQEKPGVFARIVAGLQPKQLEVKEQPFGDWSDEELAEALADLRGRRA